MMSSSHAGLLTFYSPLATEAESSANGRFSMRAKYIQPSFKAVYKKAVWPCGLQRVFQQHSEFPEVPDIMRIVFKTCLIPCVP